MSDEPQFMNVFLDLLPNQPKNDRSRENFREMLRQKLEVRTHVIWNSTNWGIQL